MNENAGHDELQPYYDVQTDLARDRALWMPVAAALPEDSRLGRYARLRVAALWAAICVLTEGIDEVQRKAERLAVTAARDAA